MKTLMAILLAAAATAAGPSAYAQMSSGAPNAMPAGSSQGRGAMDQGSMKSDMDHRMEHHDSTVVRRTVVTHRTTTTHDVLGGHHRHCRTVWRHHKRVRVCR